MPPEKNRAINPQEWLRRARSNLAKARAGRTDPDVLFEDLCFDAQQAAEKAIKAVLVFKNAKLPRTHDVQDLLTLLQRNGIEIPPAIVQTDELTEYAIETRYPGWAEDVAEDEYRRAVELAERAVSWATGLINGV